MTDWSLLRERASPAPLLGGLPRPADLDFGGFDVDEAWRLDLRDPFDEVRSTPPSTAVLNSEAAVLEQLLAFVPNRFVAHRLHLCGKTFAGRGVFDRQGIGQSSRRAEVASKAVCVRCRPDSAGTLPANFEAHAHTCSLVQHNCVWQDGRVRSHLLHRHQRLHQLLPRNRGEVSPAHCTIRTARATLSDYSSLG